MIKKEDLVALSKYLKIVHHSKGRLRVRVSLAIKKEAHRLDEDFLKNFPKEIKGIKDVKVNKLIGSITINYDPDIFEPQVWEDLIGGNISDELMERLENLIKENSQKEL